MRDWQLGSGSPLALRLSADVRTGPTNYADDQIWELVMAPALALQTQYGGRTERVRIAPIWEVGTRRIAEVQGYAKRPVVRAFVPNYLRVTASPVLNLELTAEFWAMDSQAVGCRWTFANTSSTPLSLRAELGLEGLDGQVVPLEGGPVLQGGPVANLRPLVALEWATDGLSADAGGPSLGRQVQVPPGEKAAVRWMHIGVGDLAGAVERLNYWLFDVDWDEAFAEIEAVNDRVPDIRTGDPDWDAAIALAYKVALSCYVGPTGNLPYPSFIFARVPSLGYSEDPTGTDHGWKWNGQVATEAYVTLPAVAPAAPDLAKGVIRNWLAVQEFDGWMDWKPGLGGQREGKLSIPLLATCAWLIYEYDEDRTFIEEVFSGLLRFYARWFADDVDQDQDGFPEWVDTYQSAFDDCPTFVRWRHWGQAADIIKHECPDLGAYLYREALSLRHMAEMLEDVEARGKLDIHMTQLAEHLNGMWRDETACYHYRDRDSHHTLPGAVLGTCKGDEELVVSAEITPPNRLLIHIRGGVDHVPQVTARIVGMDPDGEEIVEKVPASAFYWYRGFGTATSEHLYSWIDSVRLDGLSKVYEVEVRTVDTTRIDQTLLLPLWAGVPGRDRAKALVQKTVTNPEHFWRPYGMPNCSAQDPNYDPTNREGSGGVWMMWNTMVGEALLDYGYAAESADLFTRIMHAILHTLKTEQAFREAYNSDTLEGLGEVDYIWGVVPLHWLMRLIGVRIVSARKVWAGGPHVLPWPVTVRHYGVAVERSATGTKITFPSGAVMGLTGDAWQAVEDTGA